MQAAALSPVVGCGPLDKDLTSISFLQRRFDLLHVPQRYREAVEDRMDSMKEWLLRKCRLPNMAAVPLPEAVSPPCKERTSPGFSAVVTPQNIPEFVIPGSGESSRHASLGTCSNEDLGSQSSASLPCSAHTSPGVSPRNSFSSLAVPARPPALSRSAPVSPRHEPRDFMAEFGVRSMNSLACGGGDTNADPQSLAAMSLPHFRAQTSFGFSTLSESPHTRRKESLFMHPGDLLSVHALQQQQQHLQHLQLQQQQQQQQQPAVPPMRPKSNSWDTVRTTESPAFVLCDLTNSKCPRGHVTPACAPPSPPIGGQLAARTSSRRCNFYFRRRSSLADLENDDSCDDVSPAVSPDLKRRSLVRTRAASFCRCRASLRREGTLGEDCNGALPCGEEGRPARCCQACQGGAPSPPTHGAKAGEVKLGFQLLPESRQLRVDLIKADNLESPQKHLSPFAKLCLMPGKLQRQVSKVVKHTREPIFNESFWFGNVDEEALKEKVLRVKLFHKGQNLKPNEYIGETLVPLESYELLRDNRMWMALYPRLQVQDLGQLLLSTTFEPREERLRVMVNQARGLPQHHLTGPPDPYVRVEVSQGRKELGRTQTRTRKNTVQPVFKETFTFQISPRLEDLKYTTVKVTLLDHDRLRSDDVIGEVYLGFGATEETELTHWEETVQKPGQEVTMWHYVMEQNKRP